MGRLSLTGRGGSLFQSRGRMKRVTVVLSDELYGELLSAVSTEPGIGPDTWAAEAVEAALATRRLPYVIPSPRDARMIETARDHRPLMAERRTGGPMNAADIPRTDDLELLSDIT